MTVIKKSLISVIRAIVLLALAGGVFYMMDSGYFKKVPRPLAEDGKLLNIREVTSSGGIKAWLVEDHTLPLISLGFAVRGAGAVHDPIEKQGLSRLVSNTMDEGAGTRDAQQFQQILDDNSITLSFTSSRDDFFGTVKTLTRNRDLAFSLLYDALTSARFEDEAVERMRAANISRVRSSLSDPEWMAARLLNDVAFAGHPYALNSGGTVTTLSSLTADDLRQFVKTYMTRRDRIVVAVTGDITAGQLSTLLDKTFGNLPAEGARTDPADLDVPQGAGETILFKHKSPQTVIETMSPGIGRNDPDYPAFQVMNQILGASGFGSRLMEEIREKRGLTYGIYSSAYMLDHAKALNISLSTENKNAGDVMGLIRAEIARLRDTPVTQAELDDAKSYITGSLPLNLTSTSAISDLMLGLQLDDLTPAYLDAYPDLIKAVTIEDVQRVAQRILDPEKLTVIMVGDPDGVKPTRTVEKLPNAE